MRRSRVRSPSTPPIPSSPETAASLRRRLVAAALEASDLGLNPGRAGNLSARTREGFLVTPSGVPYDEITARDIVALDAAGHAMGRRAASSEWRLHRDVYASHREAQAIVHTHSPFATTLACTGRGIPAIHYEVAFAGGADIRCAPYATFGTQALSDACVSALEGRRACLLANHGVVAYGATIEAALELAHKVEALARVYWQALQVGEPRVLDADEMARVVEKLAGSGASPRDRDR